MSKINFALAASILILASVSTMTVSAGPVSAARERYAFVLVASGEAYDRLGKSHKVELSLMGTAYGTPSCLMVLQVASGSVKVQSLGTFSIVKGEGVLIQRLKLIELEIKITPPYGGPLASWHLGGMNPPLTLSSRHVLLPTRPHFTALYRLQLTGEITFS